MLTKNTYEGRVLTRTMAKRKWDAEYELILWKKARGCEKWELIGGDMWRAISEHLDDVSDLIALYNASMWIQAELNHPVVQNFPRTFSRNTFVAFRNPLIRTFNFRIPKLCGLVTIEIPPYETPSLGYDNQYLMERFERVHLIFSGYKHWEATKLEISACILPPCMRQLTYLKMSGLRACLYSTLDLDRFPKLKILDIRFGSGYMNDYMKSNLLEFIDGESQSLKHINIEFNNSDYMKRSTLELNANVPNLETFQLQVHGSTALSYVIPPISKHTFISGIPVLIEHHQEKIGNMFLKQSGLFFDKLVLRSANLCLNYLINVGKSDIPLNLDILEGMGFKDIGGYFWGLDWFFKDDPRVLTGEMPFKKEWEMMCKLRE